MVASIVREILGLQWAVPADRVLDVLPLFKDRGLFTLKSYSMIYMQEYSKSRNKPNSFIRKETAFKFLNQFLGRLNLETINRAHLHKYVQWRKSAGLSEATVNREIAVIKHLLNYAVDCGVLKANPVEKFKLLKEERRERPRVSYVDINRVIDAVRPDCRPLFVFLRETGCRREEALALQHWQVHEASNMVVFTENTKSRKCRHVELTPAAIEAVHTLPAVKDCPYVFYNIKTKGRWRDCRKPWLEARANGGLPGLQVKDLRRHYAIELAENGASMHDIQQVLGHASVSTTERYYAHFSPQHSARKILKVLEGGRSNGTKTGPCQSDKNIVQRREVG